MDVILLGACEHAYTHTQVGGGYHTCKRDKKEKRKKKRENIGGIAESSSVFFNLVVVWGGFAHEGLRWRVSRRLEERWTEEV